VEGYIKGDKEVEMVNVTPDGTIRFQLPAVKPTCMVTKSFEFMAVDSATSTEQEREDVEDLLDALCVIPDDYRLYLVRRGLCPINDLIALEVNTIEVRLQTSACLTSNLYASGIARLKQRDALTCVSTYFHAIGLSIFVMESRCEESYSQRFSAF